MRLVHIRWQLSHQISCCLLINFYFCCPGRAVLPEKENQAECLLVCCLAAYCSSWARCWLSHPSVPGCTLLAHLQHVRGEDKVALLGVGTAWGPAASHHLCPTADLSPALEDKYCSKTSFLPHFQGWNWNYMRDRKLSLYEDFMKTEGFVSFVFLLFWGNRSPARGCTGREEAKRGSCSQGSRYRQ